MKAFDSLAIFHHAPAAAPDPNPHPAPQLCLLLRIACSIPAGRERRWDAVQAHESVAAVLYNSQLNAFIVVRQFRAAIYAVRWRAAKAARLPEPPPAAGAHRRHYLLLLPASNTESSDFACMCSCVCTEKV